MGTQIKEGDSFGRLTAVRAVGKAADGHIIWRCACECGKFVERQTNNLRGAGLKSCGCAQRDLQMRHGMRGSPEYSSWLSAKARCERITDKSYADYGGRGIRMDPRWSASFEAFFSCLGPRPAGTTIERLDVNGDYEPGNCVWATLTAQARNRRRSVFVEWNGKRTHLCDVADELGITYGAAFMRLKRGQLNVQRI